MGDMTGEGARAGFSSRAIRAATRPPRVDQVPDSVPIYQAVAQALDAAGRAPAAEVVAARA